MSASFAGAAAADDHLIDSYDRSVDSNTVNPGSTVEVTETVTLDQNSGGDATNVVVSSSFDSSVSVDTDAAVTTEVDGESVSAIPNIEDGQASFVFNEGNLIGTSLDAGTEITVSYTLIMPDSAADYTINGDAVATDADGNSETLSSAFDVTVEDDTGEPGEAAVAFDDQPSNNGNTVLVDSATPSQAGDVLAIWSLDADGNPDERLGSKSLSGSVTNEVVELDTPIEEDQTLVAVIQDQSVSGDILAEDTADVSYVESDEEIGSPDQTETKWQGQVILLQGDFTAGEDYQVRSVDGVGDSRSVGSLEREVRAFNDDELILFTEDYGEGLFITETDEQRYANGDALSNELSQEPGFGFEIAVQTLDVEGGPFTTVQDGTLVVDEIDSIRSSYALTVTAVSESGDEFDLGTLTDVADREEDVELDASGLPLGEYTLLFNATDTTASDSADAEIIEQLDPEVTIDRPTTDERYNRGDIVPIVLDYQGTDTGTVTFGDREAGQNVEINATVVDADADGSATVYLNTFQVGSEERNHGFVSGPDTVIEDVDPWPGIDDQLGGSFVAEGDDDETPYPGGAVLAAASYDIVSVAGSTPWKANNFLEDDRSAVRVNERDTTAFELYTAPGTGDSNLEDNVETVDDIEDEIEAEDGLLNEAQGTVADGDFLVVRMESSGLEGLLHEALMTQQEANSDALEYGDADALAAADQLLFSPGQYENPLINAFQATSQVAVRQNAPQDSQLYTVESENFRLPLVTQVHLDGAPDPNVNQDVWLGFTDTRLGVFADTDEEGTLSEYYIASRPGNNFGNPSPDIEDGTPVTSLFTVTGIGATGDLAANREFVNGESEWIVDSDGNNLEVWSSSETSVNQWEYKDDVVNIDQRNPDGTIRIPQEDNVTMSGTTPIAGGTNMTYRLSTVSGAEDPFFKSGSARVQHQDGEPNTWSFEEDFGDERTGVGFTLRMTREGSGAVLHSEVRRVPGVITEAPAVNELSFEDQNSPGTTVVVNTFNTTQGGVVGIYDSDDNLLGTSPFQAIGEQTNIAIPLDEPIEEEQELTARALRVGGDRAYQNDSGEPVERTAMVTVGGEPAPAFFSVADLNPAEESLEEPGPEVTVTATVTNTGETEATQTVELTIGGQSIDSQDVTLAGGESTTVEFTAPSGDLEGGQTYRHVVASGDDEAAGALTLGTAATPTPEPTPTATPEPTPTATPEPTPTPEATATEEGDDGSGPGFGVVVALLAFLGAALLAVRREVRE